MKEHVTIINPIEVPAGREADALAIWDSYAAFFRKQPGYIQTKLHRAIDPKAKFHYVNVAEWESMDAFVAALHSEEIKSVGDGFPSDMPHFPAPYEVIRAA